jgi:hypothetical protein
MVLFKHYITKLSIVQIPKELLKKEVIELLRGREAYLDVDFSLGETIYHGDVFENILIDLFGKEKDSNYPNRMSIRQLKDLKEITKKHQYIQLTTT